MAPKRLTAEMRRLQRRADIRVVRVRGLVPRPVGAEAGGDASVERGGGGGRVEGGKAREVVAVVGKRRDHGGEFGEERRGGGGGGVAEDGAFVGVEAGEDGDADEGAGAEGDNW